MYSCKYVEKSLDDVEFIKYEDAIEYIKFIGYNCLLVSPKGIDVCCYINGNWIMYH